MGKIKMFFSTHRTKVAAAVVIGSMVASISVSAILAPSSILGYADETGDGQAGIFQSLNLGGNDLSGNDKLSVDDGLIQEPNEEKETNLSKQKEEFTLDVKFITEEYDKTKKPDDWLRVQGIEYKVYNNETNELVGKGITDKNGEFSIKSLPEGSYKWTQSSIPEKYKQKSDYTLFSIHHTDEEVVIYGLLQLKKVEGGPILDADGNPVDEDGNKLDEDGNIIPEERPEEKPEDKPEEKPEDVEPERDENGNIIGEDGKLYDDDGNLVNKDGHYIDEEGRLINNDGHLVDEEGRLIDENGNLVDENGNIIVDKPVEDDKDKPVEDDKDKPVEDDKDKPVEDDKDKPVEDDKDKPDKDKPVEDDKDKPVEDDKDKSVEDDKDKPTSNDDSAIITKPNGSDASNKSNTSESEKEQNEQEVRDEQINPDDVQTYDKGVTIFALLALGGLVGLVALQQKKKRLNG